MPVCPKCLSADCGYPTTPCINNEFLDTFGERNANGTYSLDLRSKLPDATRAIPDLHIDALTKHKSVLASPLVLSTAADTLRKSKPKFWEAVDGTDEKKLGLLIEIFRHSSTDRPAIMAHIEGLRFSGLNDDFKKNISDAILMLYRIQEADEKAGEKRPKHAADLENRASPLSRLLIHLVNFCLARLDMSKLAITPGQFDPETGDRKVEKFETLKVVSDHQLRSRIFRHFEDTIAKLPGNGDREAWRPLLEAMESLADNGSSPQFVMSLFFECLKKIDSSDSITVVLFMERHFNITFSMFEMKWGRENEGSDGKTRGRQTQNGGLNNTTTTTPTTAVLP